jgi:hypothetical protein
MEREMEGERGEGGREERRGVWREIWLWASCPMPAYVSVGFSVGDVGFGVKV